MFKSHFLLGKALENSYNCKYFNKIIKIVSFAKKYILQAVTQNQK